jgi:hypothetical protein
MMLAPWLVVALLLILNASGPPGRRAHRARPRDRRGVVAMQVTPINETAVYGLAAALLGLAVAGAISNTVGLVLGCLISASALALTVSRHRELARRRRSADTILESLPGTRVPDGLQWRAAELTSPSHRRFLARQLHDMASIANEKCVITSIPVSLSTLRPNHDELESIADLIGQLDHPVDPRGIVMLEEILDGSGDSPLYEPCHAEELERALVRVHRMIESH